MTSAPDPTAKRVEAMEERQESESVEITTLAAARLRLMPGETWTPLTLALVMVDVAERVSQDRLATQQAHFREALAALRAELEPMREAIAFLLDFAAFGEPSRRDDHACGPEGACDGECVERARYSTDLRRARLAMGLDPFRAVVPPSIETMAACDYLHCGEPGGCPVHSPGKSPTAPDVEVRRLPADDSARLFVNGYGVATWRAGLIYANDSTADEYACSVAEALRRALTAAPGPGREDWPRIDKVASPSGEAGGSAPAADAGPDAWVVLQAGAPFGVGWLDESQAKAQGLASALGDSATIAHYVDARKLTDALAECERLRGEVGGLRTLNANNDAVYTRQRNAELAAHAETRAKLGVLADMHKRERAARERAERERDELATERARLQSAGEDVAAERDVALARADTARAALSAAMARVASLEGALNDLASQLNANDVHVGNCKDFGARIMRHLNSLAFPPSAQATTQAASVDADDIRAQGWAVAVHNDYRLNGEPHTFWLFTKEGRCVKGEGRTDDEALRQIQEAVERADPVPPPCGHRDSPDGPPCTEVRPCGVHGARWGLWHRTQDFWSAPHGHGESRTTVHTPGEFDDDVSCFQSRERAEIARLYRDDPSDYEARPLPPDPTRETPRGET